MLVGESKDNWASLMTWAANHAMDIQRLRISTPITVNLVSLGMSCAKTCNLVAPLVLWRVLRPMVRS
jgi:hypothetical protein